jgi:DNA-directed RNA polymerase specialized sigma24 family protein
MVGACQLYARHQFQGLDVHDTTSLDPEVAERTLVQMPEQQHHIHVADVAAALQKLPYEQREVLLLIGANGVSYEDAAEIIGCAIGTIKSRLARGRKALAVLIEGADEDVVTGTLPPSPRRQLGSSPTPME